MDFEKNRQRSLHIHQYKCKCSSERWWGSEKNNKCKYCKKIVNYLDLKSTIGIGWFQCPCGRRYAGFSRGDVTSKCHKCNTENYPLFIVSGDKAEGDKPKKETHFCAKCEGRDGCPIVKQALENVQNRQPLQIRKHRK